VGRAQFCGQVKAVAHPVKRDDLGGA
jgi:hypothetical protein